MNLLIMGVREAGKHNPQCRTYLIQLGRGNRTDLRELEEVAKDKEALYRGHRYFFDDIFPGDEADGSVLFTGSMAKEIIEGFRSGREECENLLVHCSRGENRSPAVGIALNDVFKLGHDSEALRVKHDMFNKWVYSVMREAGGLPPLEGMRIDFLPYRPRR